MTGMRLQRSAKEPKTVRLTDPAIDASIPVGLNGHASIDQRICF
jgi:hypothetical protein